MKYRFAVDPRVEHLYALMMATRVCVVDEIVLSSAEFVDAWASPSAWASSGAVDVGC